MMQWKEDLRLRYQGRFVFSIFPRGHVSWCHLKVIQGPRQTLVILASEEDNPGTFIANGAAVLATQIVNLFDLEPARTLFLERTPPVDHHAEMRQWAAQELPASVHRLPVQTLFGTSEDKYEHLTFTWAESSDDDGPRFLAHDPVWEWMKPLDVIRLIQEL